MSNVRSKNCPRCRPTGWCRGNRYRQMLCDCRLIQRPFYDSSDPFCENREPVDSKFTLDHFYQKLFQTVASLQTEAAKKEGEKRLETMKKYLTELKRELSPFASPTESLR